MKKTVLILAALALVGCAKEVSRVETAEAPALPASRTVTITAGFDQTTKTAYDDQGKFSWVAGDKIGVLVSNGQETKQVTFVADASGATTTFTGQLESGYQLTDLASYPFTGEYDGYACNDLAWDPEVGGWRIWGSIKPSATDPLSCTPLIGKRVDDTQNYNFSTAVGIVKFTVKNVPMETVCAYFEVPGDMDSYNLNGWFDISQTGYLSMTHAVDPWQDRYNWNVPTEMNSTMDYYFFLPVGTLPEGTVFELLDGSWGTICSFQFKKEVAVVRNAVTNIAPIVLDPSATFTLADILGTYDMTVTAGPYSDNAAPGALVIEASDDATKGNIMITKFAGISGKQYGNFDGVNKLIFPCDQLFAANPYDTAADKPYVAIDFYNTGIGVVDPEFLVLAQGKLQGLSDAMGFRGCTELDWYGDAEAGIDAHGGSWPWELCYSSLIATWHTDNPDEGSKGEDLHGEVDVDPWSE